jgi:hypothetical protein
MNDKARDAANRWGSQQIPGVKQRPPEQIHDKHGNVVMSFGLHKDKKIVDLETWYLKNLLNNVVFKNKELEKAIETELNRRYER